MQVGLPGRWDTTRIRFPGESSSTLALSHRACPKTFPLDKDDSKTRSGSELVRNDADSFLQSCLHSVAKGSHFWQLEDEETDAVILVGFGLKKSGNIPEACCRVPFEYWSQGLFCLGS